MSGLRGRWVALPRAARWALLAAVFVAVYFGVVERALDAAARLNLSADAMQAGIDRRTRAVREGEDGRAALAASRFGDPLPPGRAERSAELNARIEGVFRDRRVSSLSIKARAPAPMPRGSFAGVVPESEQVYRLVLDVDFEAPPEVASAILADLEGAPEVATVGRVVLRRLEKDGRRLVQVSLAPEAWMIAPRGGAR